MKDEREDPIKPAAHLTPILILGFYKNKMNKFTSLLKIKIYLLFFNSGHLY